MARADNGFFVDRRRDEGGELSAQATLGAVVQGGDCGLRRQRGTSRQRFRQRIGERVGDEKLPRRSGAGESLQGQLQPQLGVEFAENQFVTDKEIFRIGAGRFGSDGF